MTALNPDPSSSVFLPIHGREPPRDSQLNSLVCLTSTQLLNGQREVMIEHDGQTYRLRHTRNGKLILTK